MSRLLGTGIVGLLGLLWVGCIGDALTNPFDEERAPEHLVKKGLFEGWVLLENQPGRDHGGVTVRIEPLSEGLDRDEVTTKGLDDGANQNGYFISKELAPGVYNVHFSMGGFETRAYVALALSAGQRLTLAPITLSQLKGQVTGLVEAIDSATSAGAQIVLTHIDSEERHLVAPRMTQSNADGSYVLDDLPWGTYVATASREGLTPDQSLSFSIDADHGTEEALAINALILQPVTSILKVVDDDGFHIRHTNRPQINLEIYPFGSRGSDALQMRLSENPSMSHTDGTPLEFVDFVSEIPFLLGAGESDPIAEGERTIFAQFRWKLSQQVVTTLFTTKVLLDRTPPETMTVVLAPGAREIDGQRYLSGEPSAVPLEVWAFDQFTTVTGIRVAVLGAGDDPAAVLAQMPYDTISAWGQSINYTTVVALEPGDGVKRVAVQLRDGAGNESVPVVDEVVVDTSAPLLTADPAVVAVEATAGELRSNRVTLDFFAGASTEDGIDGPVRMRYGVAPVPPQGATAAYLPRAVIDIDVEHGETLQFYGVFEDRAGNAVQALSPIYSMNLRGTVSGQVELEGDAPGAPPYGGVLVTAYLEGEEQSAGTTDTRSDGRFVLGGLPDGHYRLVFSAEGYRTQVRSGIAVTAGQVRDAGVISMMLARGSIIGRFRYGDVGESSSDNGGIVVVARRDDRIVASLVTRPDGTYAFESPMLPVADNYVIAASANGYIPMRAEGVVVHDGETTVVRPNAEDPTVADPIDLPRQVGDFKVCLWEAAWDIGSPPAECTPILYTSEAQVWLELQAENVTEVRIKARTAFLEELDDGLWQPFDPAAVYLAALTAQNDDQGRVPIYVQFRSATEVGSVLSSEVIFDTIPPHAPLLSIASGVGAVLDGFTNHPTGEVSVTFAAEARIPEQSGETAVAPVSTVWLSREDAFNPNNAVAKSYGMPALFALDAATEGRKTVHGWFCDGAGNCTDPDAPVHASIIYDVTPPRLANGVDFTPVSPVIVEHAGQLYTRSAQYRIALSVGVAADAGGVAVLDLDGEAVADVLSYRFGFDAYLLDVGWLGFSGVPAPAAEVIVPGPALAGEDGDYRIYAQVMDAAGNVTEVENNPYHFDLKLDTTAPGVSFVLDADAPFARDRTMHLDIGMGSQDPPVRVWLSQDGGRFDDYEERALPLAVTNLVLAAGPAPDGDGLYTVHARFFDAAGNVTERSDQIFLDRTPPRALSVRCTTCRSIQQGGVDLLFSNDATGMVVLETLAADNSGQISKVSYNVDGGVELDEPYVGQLPLVLPVEPQGPHSISLAFADGAGNRSDDPPDGEAVVTTIVYDRTAPVVSRFVINGGSEITSSSDVFLSVVVSDALSPIAGIRLSNDGVYQGDPQRMSGNIAWSLSSPTTGGNKTVYLEVTDAAGNTFEQTASIVLDLEPPTGALSIEGGADFATSPTVEVLLTGDGGAGYGYRLSNVPLDCAALGDLPAFNGTVRNSSWGLSERDGLKTVYGCIREPSGRTVLVSDTIELDTERPVAGSIRLSPADFTGDTSVVATLSVTGASEMCLWGDIVGGSVDSCVTAGWEALASTKAVTLTGGNGDRTVRVRYRDPAGNFTAPQSATVVLDQLAPDVSGAMVTLTGLIKVNQPSTTLTRVNNVHVTMTGFPDEDAAVPDPSGLVAMRVSEDAAFAGAAWQPYGTRFWWTLSSGDEEKSLYVEVLDAAGNVGNAVVGTIELDQTPPRPATVIINDDAEYTTIPDITVAFWVGGQAREWSVNGGQNWRSCDLTVCAQADPGESHPRTLPGGDGIKRIQLSFQDAAGNVSTGFGDEIYLDENPPDVTGSAISIVSPTDNDFTRNLQVLVNVDPPADATQMVLGMAANPGACQLSDVAGLPLRPIVMTANFMLHGVDGTKRICARLADAAGNLSAFLFDTITLDTLPPSAPQLATGPDVLNAANGSSYLVETYGAVTESHFWHYERLGGADTSWVADSTNINRTQFTFTLVSRSDDEDGVPNLLQLRAVDLAGNPSPVATVVITTDIVGPAAVTMDELWVRNGDEHAVVYWQPSASSDIDGYRVYYGPAPGSYNGQYAVQGSSPFEIGVQESVVISGLPNGSPSYVRVVAVDHAGNEGAVPSSPSEIMAQPETVPLNLIDTTSLSNMSRVLRFAQEGSYLYVAGSYSTASSAELRVVDIGQLVSPVQGGEIQSSPTGPSVIWSGSFNDSLDSGSLNDGVGMVVDYPYLYLVDGPYLRIFSILLAHSPSLLTTVDLSPRILHDVQVRGRRAVLGARSGYVITFSLDDLYDNNAATLPNAADVIGTATNGGTYPAGLTWTREAVVETSYNGGYGYNFDLNDALDSDGATIWDDSDRIGFSNFGNSMGPQPSSGNFLYLALGTSGFKVFDLRGLWGGATIHWADDLLVGAGAQVEGQFQIAGGQAFVGDVGADGLRVLELTDMPSVLEAGYFKVSGYAMTTWTDGNYVFLGSQPAQLRTFEVSVPRALSVESATAKGGHKHVIQGAFVYGSSGQVLDLQGGWPAPDLGGSVSGCSFDLARFEERGVHSMGDALMVLDHSQAVDRDDSTEFTAGTDRYSVSMGTHGWATGVASTGNYLVVAEARTTGTYLEVFRATDIRDGQPGTALDLGDSRGAYRFTTYTDDQAWADVTMHQGHAFVALTRRTDPQPTVGYYIVDLRPLLDENSATGMSSSRIQAALELNGGFETAVSGEHAYITADPGLVILDVSAALDDNLATQVQIGDVVATVDIDDAKAIDVHGSYALVVPIGGYGDGVYGIDISDPSTPEVVGFLPFTRSQISCGSHPVPTRASVSMLGSRGYVSANNFFMILDLE